jgi:hypothetical protein
MSATALPRRLVRVNVIVDRRDGRVYKRSASAWADESVDQFKAGLIRQMRARALLGVESTERLHLVWRRQTVDAPGLMLDHYDMQPRDEVLVYTIRPPMSEDESSERPVDSSDGEASPDVSD